MHSTCSSDGRQSLREILNNTRKLGFDIISITDHDNVSVYEELKEMILNNEIQGYPIVITGIEHTVSYGDYGTMCHILKHFINPEEKEIQRDIEIVNQSFWNRAKIQFERMKDCRPLQRLMNRYGISVCFGEFVQYLEVNKIKTPDYAPLIKYLMNKFDSYNVDFWKLFEELKADNNEDLCIERREKKRVRYDVVEKRFKNKNVNENERFLLAILAVRGVDDSLYPNFISSGSLSVNEYGQVNIFDLNAKGITTFAHPTEAVVETLLRCGDVGGGLVGIENNKKNEYKDFSRFEYVKQKMSLVELRGSDAHGCREDVYDDLGFYDVLPNELKKYIDTVVEKIGNVGGGG